MALNEFFAAPVSIGKDQPETIPVILETHEMLCDQVKDIMEVWSVKILFP